MPRTPDVADEKIVSYLRKWPKAGVYPSTGTVRDHLNDEHGSDYDRKTVYRRLDSLESEGEIQKVEVGQGRGKSVGWYVGNVDISDTPPANARPPAVEKQPDSHKPTPTKDTGSLFSRLKNVYRDNTYFAKQVPTPPAFYVALTLGLVFAGLGVVGFAGTALLAPQNMAPVGLGALVMALIGVSLVWVALGWLVVNAAGIITQQMKQSETATPSPKTQNNEPSN